mgnify:CR=1 FL=1
MQQTTRKIKKSKKKKKLIIFLILIISTLIGAMSLFFYIWISHRPLFISPLPKSYNISAVREQNDAVDIIKKDLKGKNIEFGQVSNNGNYYKVILKDKSEVIFSKEKDIKGQIASLQFILTKLTMEGKLFVRLDLRYDKPVIKLK